jgi:Ca2+-binding EF-hand superfamily protein
VVLLHEAAKLQLPDQQKGLIEANALRAYFAEALDLRSLTAELKRFSAVDKTQSGTLSYSEFCAAAGLPESELVREVFNLMDLDQTGELDFREYIIGRAFSSKYLSNDQTLRLAFDAFDVSGNGFIERDEVEAVLNKLSPGQPVSQEQVDALYETVGSGKDIDFGMCAAHACLQRRVIRNGVAYT